MWIGRSVAPQTLHQLFGVNGVDQLAHEGCESMLGSSGGMLGQQVIGIIQQIRRDRSPPHMPLLVVPQVGIVCSYCSVILHTLGTSLRAEVFRVPCRRPYPWVGAELRRVFAEVGREGGWADECSAVCSSHAVACCTRAISTPDWCEGSPGAGRQTVRCT